MSLTLQKIILPVSKLPSVKGLYFHFIHGEYTFNKNGIELQKHSRISFNSYFNCFYENYWKTYTNVETVKVRLLVEGEGTLYVYRDSVKNGCYEIDSLTFSRETLSEVELELTTEDLFSEVGRIFLDVATRESTLLIKSIEFYTDDVLAFDKKLSVGLCTFNKEEFLHKNLIGLVNLSKELPNLSRIIIVNQGNEFSQPELLDLIEQNKHLIDVHKQDNLGGAGGFTRTLYEASKSNLSDYHLLMDDDILLDSNVVRTAFTFTSLSKKTIAVGGQMLDLLRPTVMHEYGGKVNSEGYINALYHDLNVGDFLSLNNFNKVSQIDFNAWWFCMVPTAEIAKINLPAPIFIRGDDQEYGLRLKANGVETVGLPGVALWHEPFYVKVGGWQTYYDYRNRMILASTYEDLSNEPVEQLFDKIKDRLFVHDYQSVKLMLEAIKDFSKGPILFSEGSQNTHGRVTAIAKKFAPKSLDGVQWNPLRDEQVPVMWSESEKQSKLAKQEKLISKGKANVGSVLHLWDRHTRPQIVNTQPYIMSNGILSYFYLYEPNKEIFNELLSEIQEARNKYVETVAKNPWSEIAKFKDPEYWRTIFA